MQTVFRSNGHGNFCKWKKKENDLKSISKSIITLPISLNIAIALHCNLCPLYHNQLTLLLWYILLITILPCILQFPPFFSNAVCFDLLVIWVSVGVVSWVVICKSSPLRVFTWQTVLYMKWEKLLKYWGQECISQNDNGKYQKYILNAEIKFFISLSIHSWITKFDLFSDFKCKWIIKFKHFS